MAKHFLFVNFRPYSGVDSYDQIYTLLKRYYYYNHSSYGIEIAHHSDDRDFGNIRFVKKDKVIVYGVFDEEGTVEQYRKGYGFKIVHFGRPRNRVAKGDIVMPENASILDVEAILFGDPSMSKEGIRQEIANRSPIIMQDDYDTEPYYIPMMSAEEMESLEMLR